MAICETCNKAMLTEQPHRHDPFPGKLRFLVITKVAAPESGGNLAMLMHRLYRQTAQPGPGNWLGTFGEIPLGTAILDVRQPVFAVGEILVVDGLGREIGYPGRKPDKWDVEYEGFDDVAVAAARASDLLER